MAQQLTKEETAELYAIAEPTLPQLVELASICGENAMIKHNQDGVGYVVLESDPDTMYEPRYIAEQNHELLIAVIADGDCRLFYDQEINEFFIYQYTDGDNDGPPLGHQALLSDTVFEAAMNLWFPAGEE